MRVKSSTGPKYRPGLGFVCLTGTAASKALTYPSSTLFGAWTMEIFDYDNILLLPRKCRVESRSECDASVDLRWTTLPHCPVVPANMKTVVDETICRLAGQRNGYFYVMHRFDLDNVASSRRAWRAKGLYASISARA